MNRVTVLLATLVTSVLSVGSAHALALRVEPVSQTVIGVGSSIEVAIVVDGLTAGSAPSLGAYDITLMFDDSVIENTGVVFGDPVREGSWLSLDTSGSFAQNTAPAAGSINLIELSFALPLSAPNPFDQQPASFTLATLGFLAVGEGVSSLDFGTVVLSDAWVSELSADLQGGLVTVTAVPIPAALLFPSALLALGWLRKRR